MKKILFLLCGWLCFATTYAQLRLDAPDLSYYLILEDWDYAGNTVIEKHHPDGTIDLSYGTMGYSQPVAITPVFGAAVQSDGKIVLGGTTDFVDIHDDRVITWINTDGTIARYVKESMTQLSYDFMTSFEVTSDRVVIMGYGASLAGGFATAQVEVFDLSGNTIFFYQSPVIQPLSLFDINNFRYLVLFGGNQMVFAKSEYFDPMDGITPAYLVVESTLYTDNIIDLKSRNIVDPNTGKYGLVLEHYNADGSPDVPFNDRSLQTLQYLFDSPLMITSFEKIGDKIVVSDGSVRVQFNSDGSFDKVLGDEQELVFTCPGNIVVASDKGVCKAVVNELDPIITAGDISAISYTLSGATAGSGTGSISGLSFDKGITTVTYSETANPANTCSFTVTVDDKDAPVISAVTSSMVNIWPPNNKLVNVSVNYTASDNCGAVTTAITVTSNEKDTRGDTEQDWIIINNHLVQLRAEKGKNPKDRIYTITVTATDAAGNKTSKSIVIGVAKNPPVASLYTKPGVNEEINSLKVTVLPNPSSTYFTILTNSKSNDKIAMRVVNEAGAVIETRTGLPAQGQVQVGKAYRNGFYFAEFIQGGQRVTVKLLKQQ